MKTIDKNVVMLGWVSFFTDMASAMVNPILPIFIVVILHEGMDKLGLIVAIATFVSYLMRFVSGYLSDRYGIVKPFVVVGYALSAVTKPLLGITESYQGVAALRSLERLGKGLRSAPKDVMIATYSKKNASGKTFGFHKMLDISGELSGALLLFFLLYCFGQSETVIRNIFIATLLPGVIGLVMMLLLVRDVPQHPQKRTLSFRLTHRDRKVIKTLFIYFLFLLFMFNEVFFTMQAKEVGIAIAVIPLLFVVSTAVQAASSYLIGLWIDRVGVTRVIFFAYLSGVIAQLLLYLQTPTTTWFSYAFLGLFTVASLNANRTYIADTAENRGSVYGVFYAAVALFAAIGAYVWGLVWEQFGMSTALLSSFAGTAILLLLFIVFAKNKVYLDQNS